MSSLKAQGSLPDSLYARVYLSPHSFAFYSLCGDAGAAVALQAAAASSEGQRGPALNAVARALRVIRRSEATARMIHLAESHLHAFMSSLPPPAASAPGVAELMQLATRAVAHTSFGLLGSSDAKRAALAIISTVLQMAESGRLHRDSTPHLLSLPHGTSSIQECVWPAPAQNGSTTEAAAAEAASSGVPSTCCMLELLTAPKPVSVRSWQAKHPSNTAMLCLILEDIGFVPTSSEASARTACENRADEEEQCSRVRAFIDKLSSVGCSVLLCQKTIAPAAVEAARSADILCIPRLGAVNASTVQGLLGGRAVVSWEGALTASHEQLQHACVQQEVWCGTIGPSQTPVLALGSSVGSIVVRGATSLQRTQLMTAVRGAFKQIAESLCGTRAAGAQAHEQYQRMPDACQRALAAIGLTADWVKGGQSAEGSPPPAISLQQLAVAIQAAQVVSREEFELAAKME